MRSEYMPRLPPDFIHVPQRLHAHLELSLYSGFALSERHTFDRVQV